MEATKLRIAGESAKPMPMRVDLTMARVEALQCPAGKGRVYVYDGRMPGLAIMATSAGRKTWYVVKKMTDGRNRIRIGKFPAMSVDDARKRAAEEIVGIDRGIDPQAKRRAARAEMKFGELFAHYMEAHAKVHKRPRSWEDDQKQYDRYLTSWKGHRLSGIKRSDVQALHAKLGQENGHYAANRVLALLHKMFNVASDIGFAGDNPAHRVQKFREQSRARFVTVDELPRLMEAIDNAPDPDFRNFFKLAIFTGARRGNLQAMRWADIDLKAKTWTIPGDVAKAHEPIIVPLADPAVEILKDRVIARTKDNPWVFPSRGASGHIEEPKLAWAAILKAAKITDLRIHDLRRTMGSWQAAAGASLSVIGKSLGHKNVATTAIYSRLDLTPVRASVDAAVAAMQTAAKAKPKKAKAG